MNPQLNNEFLNSDRDFLFNCIDLSASPFQNLVGSVNHLLIKTFGLNFCIYFFPDFIVKIFAKINGINLDFFFENATEEDALFFASTYITHKRYAENPETAYLQFLFLTKLSKSLRKHCSKYLKKLSSF